MSWLGDYAEDSTLDDIFDTTLNGAPRTLSDSPFLTWFKATSTDGMGSIGADEGIAAAAVAVVYR